MGPFSFFERRRARESAIPPAELQRLSSGEQAEGQPVVGQPVVGQPFPQTDLSALQVNMAGQVDLGALMGMVHQAIQTGNVQVSQQPTQNVDLTGTGARDEILEALRRHGIDPDSGGGEIDASSIPGLQQDILETLGRFGIDPGNTQGGISIRADEPDS